jgi:hypothetical protein
MTDNDKHGEARAPASDTLGVHPEGVDIQWMEKETVTESTHLIDQTDGHALGVDIPSMVRPLYQLDCRERQTYVVPVTRDQTDCMCPYM